MKKLTIICSLAFLCLTAFEIIDYTCINLPTVPYNYANITFPSDVQNHPEIDNMPATNPTTDAGATLGRVLFYDNDLSLNHTISCASCHQQEFSFTDSARFSKGFDGSIGSRNSMGLIHSRFHLINRFFWDGRASSLEEQVLMPFQNPIEMGMTLTEVVNRVSAKSFYAPLFQSAFGSANINSDNISKALAQFVRSINSFNSKFRQGIEMTPGNPSTTPFVNFTAQENLGKDLFMDITRGNCQACHTKNLMVPEGAQNIGLDSVYADNGFGAITGNPNSSQNGKFKVPSLINVELTAPYMHDGRFKTLEEVVDFYSDSIKPHPNLSGFLREIVPGNPSPNNNPCMTCPPRKPHFSTTEKQALVAFLKTLTDTTITKDVRWSNPFCKTNSPLSVTFLEPILAYKFNNGVKIEWSTVSEINSSRFEIEKSFDGINFAKIASVNGSGSTSLKHNYSSIDAKPFVGTNYYRIKQVDFNNNFSYSKTIAVKFENNYVASIIISPNPVKNIVFIKSNAKIEKVIITDNAGRIKSSYTKPSSSINIGFLENGIYYITIWDEFNQRVTKKIIKQ